MTPPGRGQTHPTYAKNSCDLTVKIVNKRAEDLDTCPTMTRGQQTYEGCSAALAVRKMHVNTALRPSKPSSGYSPAKPENMYSQVRASRHSQRHCSQWPGQGTNPSAPSEDDWMETRTCTSGPALGHTQGAVRAAAGGPGACTCARAPSPDAPPRDAPHAPVLVEVEHEPRQDQCEERDQDGGRDGAAARAVRLLSGVAAGARGLCKRGRRGGRRGCASCASRGSPGSAGRRSCRAAQ